jgi:F0F1-type ATP synthase assembly protein I
MSNEPKEEKDASAYAMAFGLGAELLGALAVCAVPGYFVDKKFNTGPWGVLIGALLGIALGLYQLIRAATSSQNRGAKRTRSGDRR